MVMAVDGRPFVPPFPGSSLEPTRLQLRWGLPKRERGRETERVRDCERGRSFGGKRGHNALSDWNLPTYRCM